MAGFIVALQITFFAAASVVARVLTNTYPNLYSCVSESHFYSCENTTIISNSCCSPTPGGLVLQTQFWNTYTRLEEDEQLPPKDSWRSHGLWPDFCDGSYTQYCDLSRQYDPSKTTNGLPNGTAVSPYNGPGIETFILEFGRVDFLITFSKHATCTSTFDIACYANYKEHEDVVNYFDAVERVFQHYSTFDMLAVAGIVPSNSTLAQIQNTIKTQTGATPYVGCSNKTILTEMWYFAHVLGTEQYGHHKPVESTTASSCADSGIQYPERTPTSEHEVRALP